MSIHGGGTAYPYQQAQQLHAGCQPLQVYRGPDVNREDVRRIVSMLEEIAQALGIEPKTGEA